MNCHVYILYSHKLKHYYIGQTVNIEERLQQHNSSFYKNASTKTTNDWELFWHLQCRSKKQALQIESHIKRMRNKTYYHNLKKYPEISIKLLKKYSQ